MEENQAGEKRMVLSWSERNLGVCGRKTLFLFPFSPDRPTAENMGEYIRMQILPPFLGLNQKQEEDTEWKCMNVRPIHVLYFTLEK